MGHHRQLFQGRFNLPIFSLEIIFSSDLPRGMNSFGFKSGVTGQECERAPGVVAGLRTMQISNIADAISKFVHITHECMDSKELIM